MNYCFVILLILFLGCTPKEDVNFKYNKMYYCAYANYLELIFEHPIGSIGDFKSKKKLLNEISPKGDANYYEVVSKNNKKIVYVHSIKTNKLKEIIILNKKGWIDSKKIFDNSLKQIKECTWSYSSEKGNMIVHQKCDDNSEVVKYYQDNKDEELRFKNNKLVEKLVYNKNTRYRYDSNGKMIDKFPVVSESDMCIPFKPY